MLVACGSQPPAPEQPAAGVGQLTPKPLTTETPPVRTVVPPRIESSGLDALRNPASILSKRSVFFDYDNYAIKDQFKALLEAHGRFLASHPEMKMLIQGNTDERGSREYNIALGQKRADATKKALLLFGAREEQIESVSLGKEKPRNPGHDEAAWAENRRADMLYTGEY
jgi:peptidoglycan-associated lipoprotein